MLLTCDSASLFKLAGVEVGAAGVLDSLLAEIVLQRVGETVLGMVDKVVEGTPSEVTEQDVFAVLPFFQPVEREEQRVVAVVLEAGGDGGDVQQIVGFDDDEAGIKRSSSRWQSRRLSVMPSCRMRVR